MLCHIFNSCFFSDIFKAKNLVVLKGYQSNQNKNHRNERYGPFGIFYLMNSTIMFKHCKSQFDYDIEKKCTNKFHIKCKNTHSKAYVKMAYI